MVGIRGEDEGERERGMMSSRKQVLGDNNSSSTATVTATTPFLPAANVSCRVSSLINRQLCEARGAAFGDAATELSRAEGERESEF